MSGSEICGKDEKAAYSNISNMYELTGLISFSATVLKLQVIG